MPARRPTTALPRSEPASATSLTPAWSPPSPDHPEPAGPRNSIEGVTITTHALEHAPVEALDEFDLDVRISTLPGPDSPQAGFSTWFSCKGTCGNYSCWCPATGASVQACCA
ncbi:FDLD family class I lanthipeptide [Actinomadura sp. 3N407]|uniref:FDLD family class I lanthipeptide n=1 Tax=Actinomadura sp. 3N407 TaxID=3457423 RepID=UPI003FCE5BA6